MRTGGRIAKDAGISSPDSVTIYQMEVPYNTGIYEYDTAESGERGAVAPSRQTTVERRAPLGAEALSGLKKAGYTVSSG